jgi:hypothetical protein
LANVGLLTLQSVTRGCPTFDALLLRG